MNRRSFLQAATGCAVAVVVPIPSNQCLDFSATSLFGTVFWVCNLDTGVWRQVDEFEFMGGKP